MEWCGGVPAEVFGLVGFLCSLVQLMLLCWSTSCALVVIKYGTRLNINLFVVLVFVGGVV